MLFEIELAAAREIGELACRYVHREYESFAAIADAPVDISTHVDRASQELILNYLHDRFPGDALRAEENTAALKEVPHFGPRVWVVDPIDGTRGFARKTGQFSIMIGLLVDDHPAVGIVVEPALKRTTYAALGSGCWSYTGDEKPARCHVSKHKLLSESVLVQSQSRPGQTTWPVQVIQPGRVVETYSGGVKLALVARGECDIYANTYDRFADWDICAGHILVNEAGGNVTDLRGQAIAYSGADFSQTNGLLATNGLIHAIALERLAKPEPV